MSIFVPISIKVVCLYHIITLIKNEVHFQQTFRIISVSKYLEKDFMDEMPNGIPTQ